MADYTTNRHAERFTYKRVSWADFATQDRELGEYASITGGTIDYGAYTTLKATASLNYTGDAPDTTDLLRVYYSFTDAYGTRSEERALGTFLVGYGSVQNLPAGGKLLQTGTVSGYSTLKVLEDRLCGLPLTIPAGTDPVQYAASLIRSVGLRVNVQQDASGTLTAPHTFEPEDSCLTVVNWCLTNNPMRQYQSAFVDGYGVVQVQPYQDPTARTPVWTFRDDASSIMLPSVSEENEWQTSANVVRLYHESDTEAMWASAENASGSRASLSSRGGRETTYYEEVDEIADLDALKALAVTRLRDRSAEIERVSLTHAFVPIGAGDAIRIEYADRSWSGTVQNMNVTLAPSAQCATQIRRAVSAALAINVDGAVLWTA